MPATEAYWRNLKKMHVWFALSAVALLVVTICMMAKDHNREYFEYQRKFYELQALKAEAKITAIETEAFAADIKRLESVRDEAKRKIDEREDVIAPLREEYDKAQLAFSLAELELKLRKSKRDVAKANHGLAVRDEKSAETLHSLHGEYATLQKAVDDQQVKVEELKAERDTAKAKLDAELKPYTDAVAALKKKQEEVDLLKKTRTQLSPEGGLSRFKRWTMELPILQGFNSHLEVKQDWLPNLPITLGMTQTARFDRCRTCHLGADHVEAGNVPTFPHGQVTEKDAERIHKVRILEAMAKAKKEGTDYVEPEKWDTKELKLWVAANKFPHPYATHPNPDLYMTSSSPHPVATFGCTICHDGNGSGTSFQNAEHGPGNPHQAKAWEKKYHYHPNHYWEYPMKPGRTLQSTCIKCHHSMEELGTHPKFGNSAPKVFAGYRTIQKYGCFGCHEVHGFEGDKSIGPDLRLEPNYTEAALQFRWLLQNHAVALKSVLKSTGVDLNAVPDGLVKRQLISSQAEAKSTATAIDAILNVIINSPVDSSDARLKFTKALQQDLKTVKAAIAQAKTDRAKSLTALSSDKSLSNEQRKAKRAGIEAKLRVVEAALLPNDAVALLDLMKDAAHPGRYRKPGPSLRHVRSKTSREFIRYWTEEPKRFRPTTKMPQFFKLTNLQDAHGKNLSQIELAALAEYLHEKSQSIELLSPAKDYKPNADDGKKFFEQKGCLACHTHKSAPKSKSDFGPDLSRIAAKIKRNSTDPNKPGFHFSDWLYTWLREPQRYHKRSKMPHLFLSTEEEVPLADPKKDNKKQPPAGKSKKVRTRKADVAADITAFLLKASDDDSLRKEIFGNHADTKPLIPAGKKSRTKFLSNLDELATLYLRKALTKAQVDLFYRTRKYPITNLAQIKGDEIEFAREADGRKLSDAEWEALKLRYVGRRTISRYGCYGCHDVPGFERARPIGTTLQDWGRKESSKLALEHIAEYLQHHGEPDGSSTIKRAKQAISSARTNSFQDKEARERELGAAHFVSEILHHNRAGFLWQKLRQPRSYDYEKIETKGFDERLRMPKFPFSEKEVEEVATFVLGLVAEPPPHQYQYKPTGAALARVEGERLLNKYNCTGCHMVDLPKVTYWANTKIAFGAGKKVGDGNQLLGHDLLMRLMPPRKMKITETRKGEDVFENETTLSKITFQGLRVFDPKEDPAAVGEPDGGNHYFHNWEHFELNGRRYTPSDRSVRVPRKNLISIDQGRGGDFAEWLFARQKNEIKQKVRAFTTKEANLARHQLPPVLYKEGIKVQTPWLYHFLIDPYQIRRTTVLRMPRFNLSTRDARMLANYFAAVDGVPFPYQNVPQRTQEYVEARNRRYREHLDGKQHPDYLSQGWKFVVNPKTACRNCHSVGGYEVQATNDPNAIDAPNLQSVPDRLRPDWTLLWISNPKWITPYTAMPINFDKTKNRNPAYFGGNESIQIKAVRDALMNYHQLMEQHGRTKFTPDPTPGKTGAAPKKNPAGTGNKQPQEKKKPPEKKPKAKAAFKPRQPVVSSIG